ncbi:CoA transferase [Yinghuangia seranimata]|uniref:CoA transferase n=1 Tax=Yinghuangia seranimata TaxID=408067 RepID=UPI00248C33FC|nr:CoA transferase [Yinghuangia seranimata]MDI2125723.1 CoA transferase [Yinghuangia seranimata]
MALTGRPDGPPLVPASGGDPAAWLTRELGRFRETAERCGLPATAAGPLPDCRLLGERAALGGFVRQGRSSPGGAFRLMRAGDGGWLGINLARACDAASVPALTEGAVAEPSLRDRDWAPLEAWVGTRTAREVCERALLLEIPAARVPDDPSVPRQDSDVPIAIGPRAQPPAPGVPPLVIDLSALWAGPLCAHLLGLAGASVVKVESTRRPDGARFGPAAFYDLLHAGHASVAFDFANPDEVVLLKALLAQADIVVEASRPRALARLGIRPEDVAARRPGPTWVSVTAFGRTGPGADRPGFGDDVAVAAGLFARDADGTPLVCGDALADPLTGVRAAVAALNAYAGGGGVLLDVAMSDVAAEAAAFSGGSGRTAEPACAAPPFARSPSAAARPLGADTDAVLKEFDLR